MQNTESEPAVPASMKSRTLKYVTVWIQPDFGRDQPDRHRAFNDSSWDAVLGIPL